jgi:hypothetical protein
MLVDACQGWVCPGCAKSDNGIPRSSAAMLGLAALVPTIADKLVPERGQSSQGYPNNLGENVPTGSVLSTARPSTLRDETSNDPKARCPALNKDPLFIQRS